MLFSPQTIYATGHYPQCVVAVDVNSDNKPDIIAANYGADNVGVFLSLTESGKFRSAKLARSRYVILEIQMLSLIRTSQSYS